MLGFLCIRLGKNLEGCAGVGSGHYVRNLKFVNYTGSTRTIVGFFKYASKYTQYTNSIIFWNIAACQYLMVFVEGEQWPYATLLPKSSVLSLLACSCWICMKVKIYLHVPFYASQLHIIEIIGMPATTITLTKLYSEISLLACHSLLVSFFNMDHS